MKDVAEKLYILRLWLFNFLTSTEEKKDILQLE
jgi:hypothetical protein